MRKNQLKEYFIDISDLDEYEVRAALFNHLARKRYASHFDNHHMHKTAADIREIVRTAHYPNIYDPIDTLLWFEEDFTLQNIIKMDMSDKYVYAPTFDAMYGQEGEAKKAIYALRYGANIYA